MRRFREDEKKEITDHSLRVGNMVKEFLESLESNSINNQHIYIAALLHDNGKFKIDPDILNKPFQLTKQEFEYVKKHPLYGSLYIK